MTIRPPSQLFVFIDEHEKSIDDGFWEMSFVNGPGDRTWLALPADRHRHGCNLSFADGHVEPWRWRAPKKFASYGQPVAGEFDLRDLRKLQVSCP